MTPTNDNASAATSEGQHKITVCIKPLYMALFKMQPARGNRHLTTRTSAADQSSQVLLSSVIWMQELSLYQKRSVNTICANHKHNKSCQLLCELAVYCTHLWGFLIPELEAENINSEMMCCICRSLMYCDLRLSFGRPSASSLQAPLHSLRDPSKPHVSLPYTHVWVKMMACACQYSYTTYFPSQHWTSTKGKEEKKQNHVLAVHLNGLSRERCVKHVPPSSTVTAGGRRLHNLGVCLQCKSHGQDPTSTPASTLAADLMN